MPSHLPHKTVAASVAILLAAVGAASAQIIVSNSKVTYTYYESPLASFASAPPVTSASPESSLLFAPSGLTASPSGGGGFQSDSVSGILTVDMDAAPGLWFSGDALTLRLDGTYFLYAPFSTSQASASINYLPNLTVYEVDGNAFSSLVPLQPPLPELIITAQTVAYPSGGGVTFWNKTWVFDLNEIKTHFGIGAGNNVTGMRLQFSTTVSAATIDGIANANLQNLSIGNVTVPEPSTYALLGVSALSLALLARRRRR